MVSVPLRGEIVSCMGGYALSEFTVPSPCGVWVVSMIAVLERIAYALFPSPCGVWVVSEWDQLTEDEYRVSVP